jgi:MFS family permease
MLGNGILSFFYYGVSKWQPTFFIRSYGMSTYQVGAWFGVILGGGMIIGTLLSGEWPRRWAPGNERRQLVILALIFCMLVPVSAAIYFTRDYRIALLLMTVNAIGMSSTFGPLYASVPMVVPANMRAMAIALIYLSVNLIGVGLGPVTVGALSDALSASYGNESLRYALLLMTPGFLWGAWHLRSASHHVQDDIGRADRAVFLSEDNCIAEAAQVTNHASFRRIDRNSSGTSVTRQEG